MPLLTRPRERFLYLPALSAHRLEQLQIPELVAAARDGEGARSIKARGRPAVLLAERGLKPTSRGAASAHAKPAEPARKSRRLEGLKAVSYSESGGAIIGSGRAQLPALALERGAARSLSPVPLDALNLLTGVADPDEAVADAAAQQRRGVVRTFLAGLGIAAPEAGNALTDAVDSAAVAPARPARRRGVGSMLEIATPSLPDASGGSAMAPAANVATSESWWKRSTWTLAEDDIAKVTRERIYRMAFVATSDRVAVAAGDKVGHVGLWDVGADPTAGDSTELLLFRPHRNVVSAILVRAR